MNQTLPTDLTAEMQRLRDTKPDAIVMALYPPQAKRAMEAKARLDWKDVRMVSTGPLTDEEYLNVPGGYAEGTLGLCYYPDPNHSDAPGVVAYRRLMAKYFPDEKLNRYSLYGYAFGQMVIEGLRRAGPNPTRESFIDAMETIKNWDSGGILPPVTFPRPIITHSGLGLSANCARAASCRWAIGLRLKRARCNSEYGVSTDANRSRVRS